MYKTISEDNLSSSNIFIDIADGNGVAKFDTAPFDTDLFTWHNSDL